MKHNIFNQVPSITVSGKDNVFANFLQSAGLYDSMEINEDNIQDLIFLLDGKVRISAYCKGCKTERVFTMKPYSYFIDNLNKCHSRKLSETVLEIQRRYALESMPSPGDFKSEKNTTWRWKDGQIDESLRILVFKFVCSMNDEHHLDYIVLTTDNSMMKIGQYPTVADMTFSELDDYKYVISKQDRKELGTAIGLFAAGVGAGSYVYLRRILERLVYQAKANAGDTIDDEKFEQARVAERIKMLEGYLPEVLIKNTMIYGILSKGIHELSEEECLKYFPVVKECIYQILGMWESLRRKQADEAALSKALSAITSSIK
ncbi:hypothetical protein [Clostridium sp. M62/1]|uniref:hypothetical protein n=1 Tax=Clostridium sp. M62/1 TaxID=411486 RepID=UPI00356B486A